MFKMQRRASQVEGTAHAKAQKGEMAFDVHVWRKMVFAVSEAESRR